MKEASTPLMKQYEDLKAQHPDAILLFRLGDFYEMFNQDAKMAAPILEVALTQRQGVPMCGIPFHAIDRYLSRLLKKGLRIAIAEQLEDPATTKGLVKRDIIRIISAGTLIEENLLKEKTNNFLSALALKNGKAGMAALDVSTGQFVVTEIDGSSDFTHLKNELSRLAPVEILTLEGEKGEEGEEGEAFQEFLCEGIPVQTILLKDLEKIEPEQQRIWNSDFWKKVPLCIQAGRMIQHYIQKMNPSFLKNIQSPQFIAQTDAMVLDRETLETLEILKNTLDGSSQKTVLDFLDRTLTPMGGRLLKHWLSHPLVQLSKIQERLNQVQFFVEEGGLRKQCREILKGFSDLERIIIRLGSHHANPRDLIGLKISLQKAIQLKALLQKTPPPSSSLASWHEAGSNSLENGQKPVTQSNALVSGSPDIQEDWCHHLTEFIDRTIIEEPPITLDQGGVIRPGVDAFLDEKRNAAEQGKQWLQDLEIRERETSGIPNLKIGYTSVFGYYFEVTKTHLSKVPPSWHRKQTLINVERFVNEELKSLETKILGAQEQATRLERALFQKAIQTVQDKTTAIQQLASKIAHIDCWLSLAEVAAAKSLVRPEMDHSDRLEIEGGWHPVVQESLPPGRFVSNDVYLNRESTRIMILTGPNMSGKSTYLRQTAIIVLMAQAGSFVPAQRARIGLVDRIFTRIGSGDRLAQGQSTFMVEMQETASILKQASAKSLIILDEVGRGTSTYDGISIAWSIIEYLARAKPKVLFATHYFELTDLENTMEGIKNFNVEAKEVGDRVIFLHKIVPGPADRSYGIHVAQLAGLPISVLKRANQILKELEQKHEGTLKEKQAQLLF